MSGTSPRIDFDQRMCSIAANPAAEDVLGEAIRPGEPVLELLRRTHATGWTIVPAATGGYLIHRPSEPFTLDAVAHDLSNLLTCILGCARGGDDPDRVAIRDAAQIAGDLLHLALRPASAPRACDVAAALAECRTLLVRVGRGHGVAVSLECTRDVRVAMPRVELQDIVVNLALNAIEALSPRGGRVAVTASVDDAGLCLTVLDDGPGIAPERLARLLEAPSSSKSGHAGLGLVTVRALVARAGGQLDLQSDTATGTRVVVRLPATLEACEGS